jgi:hypothetical protein
LKLNPYLKKVGFITLLSLSVLSLARSHPVQAESEPSEETGVKRTIKIVVDETADSKQITEDFLTGVSDMSDQLQDKSRQAIIDADNARKVQEAEAARKAAEAEAAKQAELAAQEQVQTQVNQRALPATSATPSNTRPYFGNDGLLVHHYSDRVQQVINLLSGIPGHSYGSDYHIATGLNNLIDSLTVEEAVEVLYRIEDPGFGQTGAGYAGYATPESHQAFMNQQIDGRFGGSMHNLLKAWGTFNYPGY